MKKRNLMFLSLIAGALLLPGVAKADLACNMKYDIVADSCQNIALNGTNYALHTYNVSGLNVKAYCLDPAKTSGVGSASCVSRIDPSNKKNDAITQKYDLAMAKAYQLLVASGRNTNSVEDRQFGEIIFRWIGKHYGKMKYNANINVYNTCDKKSGTVGYQTLVNIFDADRFYNQYWNGSSYATAGDAKKIYNEAVNLADTTSYDDAVKNNLLWADQYDVATISEEVSASSTKITVKLTAKGERASEIHWNEFEVGCDSKGLKCTKESIQTDGNSATITINIATSGGYTVSNAGVYVQSSIKSTMSASANMIIVNAGKARQNMLIVSDGIPILNGGSKIYITATPPKNNGPKCSKDVNNNKYYCKDGHECSEPEYRADCENINCMPTVTMPSNCNNFDEESTEKGIISDINEESNRTCSNGAVNNANQVKSCVIGHNDLTNTSYEATTELSGNPYCKVYCKEKYTFTLPTAKITRSGGYFTLTTTVDATRDCYVGNVVRNAKGEIETQGINTTLFQTEISQLQKEILDLWNSYEYYRQAASITSNVENNEASSSSDSWHYDSCDENNNCHTVSGSCSGETKKGSVVTKTWTYKVYDLNGNYVTKTENYKDGEKASCPSSCRSGKCSGSVGINPDIEHKEKRDYYKSLLLSKLSDMNLKIRQYNSCSGSVENTTLDNFTQGLTKTISTSNNDTTWSNKMVFNPKVTFDYNENYKKDITGEFKQTSSNIDATANTTYCSGEVSENYACQSGASSSPQTALQNILTCNNDGCSKIAINVSTAKWVQKSKNASATYEPKNEFATYSPYGTIKLKNKACNGNDCLYSKMPENALPISMITKTGVFPFTIKYSDIGQDNKTSTLGRLMGATTSVITEYDNLTDDIRCAADSSTKTVDQNVGYVCHYLNNCDNCKFTCTDDNNCEFTEKECDGDNCRMTCKNCAFDGSTANFTYRTISTNNLNPTSRSLGYNWNADTGENAKAVATTKAIEEDGDTVYKKAQYSYTLTPSNLQKIREYNKKAESFTNASIPSDYQKYVDNSNSLYCEQFTANTSDGKSYEIPYRCKSTFLDLANNNSTGLTSRDNRVRVTEDTDAFENFSGCTSGYGNGNCKYVGPSWRIKGAE